VTTSDLCCGDQQRPGLGHPPSNIHRLSPGFGAYRCCWLSLSHYYRLVLCRHPGCPRPSLRRTLPGVAGAIGLDLIGVADWPRPLLHRLFGGAGGRTAWIDLSAVSRVDSGGLQTGFPCLSALPWPLAFDDHSGLGLRERESGSNRGPSRPASESCAAIDQQQGSPEAACWAPAQHF